MVASVTRKSDSDYAEVLIDRLFLESFANEQSPYHVADAERSPSRLLERFRGRLKWHIAHTLSRRQREVILFYLGGKKEREIAALLGITQQVVHIYKHRAIKKLQKVFVS